MIYLMIGPDMEVRKLQQEPSAEEVYGNDEYVFLSAEIVRGDEILIRQGVADNEESLDWKLVS